MRQLIEMTGTAQFARSEMARVERKRGIKNDEGKAVHVPIKGVADERTGIGDVRKIDGRYL